jgi:hypothetical protein
LQVLQKVTGTEKGYRYCKRLQVLQKVTGTAKAYPLIVLKGAKHLYVYSWLLTIITITIFNIHAIIWFNDQYNRIITDRIFINVKLPTPMAVYKKSERQLESMASGVV